MKKGWCIIFVGIMLLFCIACAKSDEKNNEDTGIIKLYIAPDGSDKNAGTKGKPLETTEEALARIRKETYQEAYIYYLTGEYYWNAPIELTGDDHDIHFCAAEGETPRILGSFLVDGWKETNVNGIDMWVTEIEEGKRDFQSLFEEEAVLPRSRWPKEGYFSVKAPSDGDNYGSTDPNLKMEYAMYLNPDEVKFAETGSFEPMKLTDVTLKIIHWWKDETVNVKSLDLDTGRIEFSRPATMTIKSGDRYYFENVFEAMSEPGEWYMDRMSGKLYYIPQSGEEIKNTRLYAAQTEQFAVCKGADDISFEGLTFSMGDWSIPESTFNSCGADHHQAAYDVTPAFYFASTDGIVFRDCNFSQINSTCLKFGYNVQNIIVEDNTFRDIGANAVFLVGENLEKDDTRVTGNFRISNNLISGYGQCFFNATAVGILHGARGEISNNEIHDGYSTAITLGWVWGYDYSVTSDILVKQNLIYNVGQNMLSDMGAVYTLGVKDGIVITENVIHDVRANMEYGYGGWGIYMDEGSSNVMVSKNLVYDCSSTSFYQHYGQDNVVMNNIFAFSEQGGISLAKAESHVGFHLIKNIIVTDGSGFIVGMKGKNLFTDTGNFYWDYTSGDQGINAEKYSKEYGLYNMATFTDPRFADAGNRDFTLRDFSPALEKGFVKWDISKAGRREEE